MSNKHVPTPAITNNTSFSYSPQVELTGFGQPGDTVYLQEGATTLGTPTVGSDGTWSSNFNLTPGQHNIIGFDYNSNGLHGQTNTYVDTIGNPLPSFLVGPDIKINPNVTFASPTAVTITGTVSDPDNDGGVFLYSDTNNFLGYAPVSNGNWSVNVDQGTTDLNGIHATAYDAYGNPGRGDAPFSLVTGLTGEPYSSEQITNSLDGTLANAAFFKDNGQLDYSEAFQYTAAGDTLGVLTGASSHSVFTADSGDKRDSITNFKASGGNHSVLDLSDTNIHSLYSVLQHSTTSSGSTTIKLDSYSSIVLDGVTKQQLKGHNSDFKFF